MLLVHATLDANLFHFFAPTDPMEIVRRADKATNFNSTEGMEAGRSYFTNTTGLSACRAPT